MEKSLLETKSTEVSTAMTTFAEMQRITVEREGELKERLAAAETKASEKETELNDALMGAAVKNAELMTSFSDINALQEKLKIAEKQSEVGGSWNGERGVGGELV